MLNIINGICTAVSVAVIMASLAVWIKNGRNFPVRDTTGGTRMEYSREEWIVFGAIMMTALLLRLWKFGIVPGGMNQDGAMAAVDANALANHGTDRYGMFMPVHFTAWGYGQMSVLMSYCMVPFIKLFGLSVVTARLPILLAGMAGMAAVYFIGRRMMGVRAGQILLLLTAVNPWHFMQSRWALDCNMLPHMFILGLAFLLEGLDGKKAWVYFSMVFFALCMYSYGIAFYTVSVFLVVVCGYILSRKALKWRDVLICVAVYLGISWPIYLTMILNTWKLETIHTPFFTIPFFPDSYRSHDILFFAENKGAQLLSNLQHLIHIFVEGDHEPWNTIPGFGVINLCFVPFIFLGVCYAIGALRKEKDAARQIGWFSLLVFFAIGLLAGLITANVNVNRINIICYPFILFAGMGIWFAVQNCKKLGYVIAPMYLVFSVLFVGTYFTGFAERIAPVFYEDYLKAVAYVGDQAVCQRYVLTPDTQYPGAVNVSEILTLFIHNVDAEYYQDRYPDANGLKYSEKYTFANPSENGISDDNNVGYVIKREERALFAEDRYEVIPIGSYCAVIPKGR